MNLDDLLQRLGLPDRQHFEAASFRSLGDPETGAAADIERIEGDDRTVVVVTLWRWTHGAEGGDRSREGRLTFDVVTGELVGDGQGDAEAIVAEIATMRSLV